MRESMRDLLEDAGFEVVCAIEGQQALDRLREGASPDVILLDLMMGGMDGYQLLAELRRDPRHAGVPVLVLTAQGRSTIGAEQLGVAGLIRKPFDFDDLLAAIRRLTGTG